MRTAAALIVILPVALGGAAFAQHRPGIDPVLVGTWTLVSTEQNADTPQRVLVPAPRGLLIFDAAGHVFEAITRAEPAAGRGRGAGPQPPASTPPGLTPAQSTFATYSGFWGTYRTDTAKKTISYQPEGAVSPNVMGRAITRTYDVAADRLAITSMPGEPHVQGTTRWTWERVPPVESLGPTYRRVIGFWQHVVERRVNLTTNTVLSENRRAPSIIVYSPSGYVGVHFPPLGRKPFAADVPTDEEARAALQGYVGYFGALSVYPDMVFHQVLAGISPRAGDTLKRPLELSGNEVTIKFPPTRNQDGHELSTHVTLRRLSGEADMLK